MTSSPPSHRDLGPIRQRPRMTTWGLGTPEPVENSGRGSYHVFGGKAGRNPFDETLLCKLAKLIQCHNVQSAVPEVLNAPMENHAGIPAGYTYLFQLAAHDTVNTGVSAGNNLLLDEPANMIATPLSLQTLLGGGSRACPHAYDMTSGNPRLRMGMTHGFTPQRRDLARCSFDDGTGTAGDEANVVLIPDPRNDDNLLLGQLTALFHLVTNHIAGFIESGGAKVDVEKLTRKVMVALWRRLIARDLLPRLLHPAVMALYRGPDRPKLDTAAIDPTGRSTVSIEFAFAAGRLGHAMVRDIYALNTTVTEMKAFDVIDTSSSHRPGKLPLKQDYVLDWDLYFPADPTNTLINWAMRIGPHLAAPLIRDNAAQTELADGTVASGTLVRDLLRENSGGLAKLDDLFGYARAAVVAQDASLAAAFDLGRATDMVRNRVHDLQETVEYKGLDRLSEADITKIAEAPPLTLYLLLEAEAWGNGGCTLGPLASVIVAEAMRPALEDVALPEVIQIATGAFGRLPDTMPDLVAALRERNVL